MSDIFISYSREDSKFVEGLILALVDYGWSVWSDKSGISEGRPFDTQIENAISEASVTLVIWSNSSVKSRWVRAEAAYALDKDKLVPISADGADPPLQFLHIQGVNMRDWGLTCDEPSFKKLAAMLSERLDRVGRIPKTPEEGNLPSDAKVSTVATLSFWKVWSAAVFPPVSIEFDEYFTRRTFFISQFVCILGFTLITCFGLVDILTPSGGLDQTRFRLLITGPSLLILLALTFTTWARRHAQTFGTALGIVATFLAYELTEMVIGEFPVPTEHPRVTSCCCWQ